ERSRQRDRAVASRNLPARIGASAPLPKFVIRSPTMARRKPDFQIVDPAAGPSPSPERVAAFRVGLSAESRAAIFLWVKGYRIAARRWKSPVGEIDIVARRGRLLVFVEVKARASLDAAAFSLTERQKLRI